MRVCKKPIAVDSVRYKGIDGGVPHFDEAPLWLIEAQQLPNDHIGSIRVCADGLRIQTLEGSMRVEPDARVMRGVQGELWAIKGDIFEATYEPAVDAEDRAALVEIQATELDEARVALHKALAREADVRLLAEVTPLAVGINLLARSESAHRHALAAATEKGERLVVAVVVDDQLQMIVAGPDRDEAACTRFASEIARFFRLVDEVAKDLSAQAAAEDSAAAVQNPEGPQG